MKPRTVLIAATTGLLLFAGGVCAGVWFSMHYRIVPIREADTRPPTNFITAPPGATPPSRLPAPADPAREPYRPVHGALGFRFTQGERLQYRLSAGIEGSGFEQITGESPIDMRLDAGLTLSTESVAQDGTGSLRLDFEDVAMDGTFMGSPFQLSKRPGGASMRMDDRVLLDTESGQSIHGIPQLEFFDRPIRMKVGPDGTVLESSAGVALDTAMVALPLLPGVEFPNAGTAPGHQWESNVALPLPGLNKPLATRILNTFEGFTTVDNRRYGVIRQELRSDAQSGAFSLPESALGEALSLPLGQLTLTGSNLVYFEAETGRLASSEMDLDLGLELGGPLQGFADLLGAYGSLLGELEGRPAPPRQPAGTDGSRMGTRIRATLQQVE